MNEQEYLDQFLLDCARAHGLEGDLQNGWVVVSNSLPLLTADIVEDTERGGSHSIQLDISAVFDEKTKIIESFNGIGETRGAAVSNGLENFVLNSLHVFLAAFFGVVDDQVTVEKWNIERKIWTVTLGPFGTRAFGGIVPEIPEDAFSEIETLVKDRQLHGSVHWLRTFYCNIDGKHSRCEVLWDNEPWKLAEDRLAALNWTRPAHYYSVRNFLVLQALQA